MIQQSTSITITLPSSSAAEEILRTAVCACAAYSFSRNGLALDSVRRQTQLWTFQSGGIELQLQLVSPAVPEEATR